MVFLQFLQPFFPAFFTFVSAKLLFILYLTVLLERLFQFKVLDDTFSASETCNLMRKFRVVIILGFYVNLLTSSEVTRDFSKCFGFPVDNAKLSETQINSLCNYKIQYPISVILHSV